VGITIIFFLQKELTSTPSLEDGKRSSFRNVIFFGIPDGGHSEETR
jgi:hypothetical protein